MTATLKEYTSREKLAVGLADAVEKSLRAAIVSNKKATLCVPGGSTPKPFFAELSKRHLGWPSISVVPNDERFVPEDHERSNAGMIRDSLLNDAAGAAKYVSLYAPGDTPEAALPALKLALGPVLPIDVLILGMGEDMHTASLFPGADKLREALAADAPLLLPMRAPGADEPRITLSAPVLNAAKDIHLLITGESKFAALEKALEEGPDDEAPIRAILRHSDLTVHYSK